MKKTTTILLFMAFLMGCTHLMSQATPDFQPNQLECKVVCTPPSTPFAPLRVYRRLRGSDQWQQVKIYRGYNRIPLADCGWGPHVPCPYELNIYTGDTQTEIIDIRGTKTYRIYWDGTAWRAREERR